MVSINMKCQGVKFFICTVVLALPALVYGVDTGGMAPPLKSTRSYNTKDGKAISLDDFRGSAVLIDFWATWCGPCVSAMPHIQELYAKFNTKGLVVIAHTDSSSQDVGGFIKKKKLDFIFSIGTEIGKSWGVNGIPHAFLIDPSGKVVWHGHSASVREKDIEKALKNIGAAAVLRLKQFPK